MKRYWVIFKALIIVAILLAIKLVIDHFTLDVIVPSPVITALVAGVIFTMAVMFTGVLSDYKESEKIPGEMAATIRNLYKDIKVATVTHHDLKSDMLSHVIKLLKVMNANLRRNEWLRREINHEIDQLDEDVVSQVNLPPIIKLMFHPVSQVN